MGLKISNNAYGVLASGISSGATSIPLSTGHGARFGAIGAGDYMFATLIDPANQLEVVKITLVSGDNLTVVRGQDGTAPIAFSPGDRIEARPCNAAIQAAMQESELNNYDATDTGGANAYVVGIVPAPIAYYAGMKVVFNAANANTGASTVNVNALGVKSIKSLAGSALSGGQIKVGHLVHLMYDGTNFQLMNPAGGDFSTGDAKLTIKTVADAGWVMANDGTIGNAASGGTTRANADTEALFTLLWNNITNTYAAVTPSGRGASAAADFAANKKIALPKALGRALAVSGAGSGLTPRALGEKLGHEALQQHSHGITDPGHTHTVPGGQAASAGGNMTGAVIQISSSSVGSSATGITVNNEGTGTAENMQPTLFLNAMIKL